MGRWIATLREHENSKTARGDTDKTDKTPEIEVTSVLSVPPGSVCENSGGGFAGFAGALSEPFPKSQVVDAPAPATYRAAFDNLCAAYPPGVPYERWRQAVDDAGRFLAEWGETAERLGWTARDLFDLHETVPLSRMDRMGLVWLTKGQRVTLLTEHAARFERGLTFRRTPVPRATP